MRRSFEALPSVFILNFTLQYFALNLFSLLLGIQSIYKGIRKRIRSFTQEDFMLEPFYKDKASKLKLTLNFIEQMKDQMQRKKISRLLLFQTLKWLDIKKISDEQLFSYNSTKVSFRDFVLYLMCLLIPPTASQKTFNIFLLSVFLLMLEIQSWQLIGDQQHSIKLLMKSRCNSAPRMQTVLTPRVKDGRFSNDSPQKHYYGKTAPRFGHSNHSYHYNPENTPERPKQSKPAVQDFQVIIDKRINGEGVIQKAPMEIKKININQPAKANKLNKQETIHGRRLEYPAPQRLNNAPARIQIQSHQSQELMRSSSLSSKHFIDRGIKSASIKSRKEEFDQKFKVAFGYLLDSNEKYLVERKRACNQKARPKEEIFRVMRPQISTTNHDQYKQKNTPYAQYMEPQNLKTANSFGPMKVCGNSTTKEFHKGTHGPRADLAEWPEGFKLQGPLYGVTTHANHFPNHGDFEKMVPVATFNQHPMGMPHKTNSTHRTFYKGEHTDAAPLATWNNLHPYGNGFDPNRGTTYSQNHGSKEQQPIQQWPMYEPQLIRSEGKFVSEVQANLVDHTKHELTGPNYCECGRKPHKH